MKKSIYSNLRLYSLALISLTIATIKGFGAAPAKQEYFEIKIYHISQKTQENRVDAYLKDAYLPALHRAGILKAGVF